ncbi:hypothetical protein HG530_009549 [Fusarium avenaceum]|nr:hypothetical protein HG530_009549 [Fusarium avenaceum]
MPLADNDGTGSGAASPSLPLTMSASVVLADLPRDASAALATAGSFQTDKIVVRFKPVGSAPSLAQDVCKISSTKRFEAVVIYLRKKLRCKETDSVFLYINSAFAPSLDEIVGNLQQLLCRDWVRVLRARILTGLDIVPIRLDGSQALAPYITILLHKFGQESARREVSSHVNLNQNLAGGSVTSTNTNCGNGQLLSDECGHLGRNSFDNHGETASFLKCQGIFEDTHSTTTCLPLDTEATKGILSLRGQANMTKNRDASSGNLFDGRGHLLTTFKLDTLDTTFFDEADGRSKSLIGTNLIMQKHLFQDDFTSIFHTKRNHSETVTNENDIHAGMISNMATGEVMSCHDSDRITLAVHRAKSSDGNLLAMDSRRRAHGRMRAVPGLRRTSDNEGPNNSTDGPDERPGGRYGHPR